MSDGQLDAKVELLKQRVGRHIEEEEQELFLRARQQLGGQRLEELGEEMEELAEELKDQGGPRMQVRGETHHAASI